METRTLDLLFRFNYWANLHLANLLVQVPDARLRAENPRFYSGSAWTVLVHMLNAERGWLNNCKGADMTGNVWDIPCANMAEVVAYLQQSGPANHAYVTGLSEAALAAPVDISHNFGNPPRLVPRSEVLAHVVNHSTEHRCDLAHFLTNQGLSPGEMGYLDFIVAHKVFASSTL